jgi:hypothetical protein
MGAGMTIDSEAVLGAIYDIGSEENVDQISPAVIAMLIELRIVQLTLANPRLL